MPRRRPGRPVRTIMMVFGDLIRIGDEPSRFAPHTRCWNWLGGKDEAGYGYVMYRGQKWRTHRLSFYLTKSNPVGLFVCHTCDNPACCKPDHLFLGTNSDNQLDRIKWSATLTEDEIRAIRESEFSPAGAAQKHKIRPNQVEFIRAQS